MFMVNEVTHPFVDIFYSFDMYIILLHREKTNKIYIYAEVLTMDEENITTEVADYDFTDDEIMECVEIASEVSFNMT